MNFMLLVPLASYPAVEICSETSLAGNHALSQGHIVVRQEENVKPAFAGANHGAHAVDQLDD